MGKEGGRALSNWNLPRGSQLATGAPSIVQPGCHSYGTGMMEGLSSSPLFPARLLLNTPPCSFLFIFFCCPSVFRFYSGNSLINALLFIVLPNAHPPRDTTEERICFFSNGVEKVIVKVNRNSPVGFVEWPLTKAQTHGDF